ncbi:MULTISPECIES: glycosyltransferase family 4 protein [unclassified Thiocapsa]|uniref:glycosyltransferase family 4 protein n=1 Tax=unclassified Thiocapsa TaxID=2641286 RepID=UPI0035AE75CF
MTLLFLSKRRPQGRDLFTNPYGRFFHLPKLLVEYGHEVHLLLLSYRRDPAESRQVDGLHMHTVSAQPWMLWPYLKEAHVLCADIEPDWVVGFSDTWYGILAMHLGSSHGCRALIDAYDNYESYIPWAKMLHWAWRRALARADAVTAAGPSLAEWMQATSRRASVGVVPMAADPLFVPMPQLDCRRRLGLPERGVLVGYSGSLHPSRGIGQLFEIYAALRREIPELGIVLSGRLARGVQLPEGVHWLGYRPDKDVPFIVNSVDLLFVLNKRSAFGNHSYPAKLYEAMACGVPVVASDVPGSAWVLRDHPEMLATVGDVEDFVTKAIPLLHRGRVAYAGVQGWDASAAILARILGIGVS